MTATIPALLARAATEFANIEAVVDGERRMTYAELFVAAKQLAAATRSSGLRTGDRVAIWAPNSLEWIVTALGASWAGLVLVPMNTRLRGPEAATVLEMSSAQALFTVNGFLGVDYAGMLEAAGFDTSRLVATVVLEGESGTGTLTFDEFLSAGQRSDAEVTSALETVAPTDLCDIIYTSGTTGSPKGVLSRHEQNVHLYSSWCEITGLRKNDRYLIANPFSHSFGLKAGIFVCVMQGATMYPERVFDTESVMRKVHQERITALPAPPTIYMSILNHPRRSDYDLSSWRIAVPGGAVNTVTMVERVMTELACEVMVVGYGLTECGCVTMTRRDSDADSIVNTAGWPLPGIEVRIAHADGPDEGAELAAGAVGEIYIRGFPVTQGYLDEPDATARAFAPDGWLRTGDLGLIDDRGRLRITDRKKDMYIVGGLNAYPAEIENAMARHPDIAQVAVIGVPDERLGEVGMAFVVARPDRVPDPDEIIAWCRAQISNYKVPRFVEVVDALPLTATGKAQKPQLRALAADLLRPVS